MTPAMLLRSLSLSATLMLLTVAPAAAQSGLNEGQTFLLIAVVMLTILMAFGVYMIYSGIKSRRIAKASETWPTAGGTVLSSEVVERKTHDRKRQTTTYYYEPIIRYSYKVASTGYESSVIRFGDLVRHSRSLPDKLVTTYPEGATVAVRYDPSDPARATLETESAGGRQLLAGVMFIVVPLVIAVIMAILWGGPDLPSEAVEQFNQPQQP